MISGSQYRKVMKWLSPVDPRQSYEKIASSPTPRSGTWFMNSRELVSWRDSSSIAVFWMNGITGAGKTTLMTMGVKNLTHMNDGCCKLLLLLLL